MVTTRNIVLHVGTPYLPEQGGGSRRFQELYAYVEGWTPWVLSHTPGSEGVVGGFQTRRFRSCRELTTVVPRVVRDSGARLLHLHNVRAAAFLLPIIGRLPPALVEIHALPEYSMVKYAAIRLALRRFPVVLVLAEAARYWVVDRMKLDPARVLVARNGRRELPLAYSGALAEEPGLIAYIGSLSGFQGVFELAAASGTILAHEPDARIVFVGDGPERSAVEKVARRFSGPYSSRVCFVGDVSPSEAAGWYQRAQVVVMARRSNLATETTVPLKVFEAMAMGRAILASADGGMREVLRHNETAILVPCGEPAEIAQGCLALLRDQPLRTRLANAARRSVEQYPTWRRVAADVAQLYNELCDTGASGGSIRPQ